jgi:hypothetical protein
MLFIECALTHFRPGLSMATVDLQPIRSALTCPHRHAQALSVCRFSSAQAQHRPLTKVRSTIDFILSVAD